jgi:hypothetical protein
MKTFLILLGIFLVVMPIIQGIILAKNDKDQ